MAANHLSTPTSKIPQYITNIVRNVSVVKVGNKTKGGDGIYIGYGLINTGHIPRKKLLPFKD